MDEQLRQEAGPQSFLWTRPALKHSDNELKKLSDALMKAEDEHKKGALGKLVMENVIDLFFSSQL